MICSVFFSIFSVAGKNHHIFPFPF